MRAITCELELKPDHSGIIENLPLNLLPGKHSVVLVVDDSESYSLNRDDFLDLTKKTSGIWTAGDGLEYQERVRQEREGK